MGEGRKYISFKEIISIYNMTVVLSCFTNSKSVVLLDRKMHLKQLYSILFLKEKIMVSVLRNDMSMCSRVLKII